MTVDIGSLVLVGGLKNYFCFSNKAEAAFNL